MIFAKRAITAVLGLPLVLLVVWAGGMWLTIACATLAFLGLREFYFAFSKKELPIHAMGYIGTVGYFAMLYFFGVGGWMTVFLALLIVAVLVCHVVFYKKLPLVECVVTACGFFYVPFLLSFFPLAREASPYLAWLVLIICFSCDTFAYVVGSLFGKKKLKNSPSPSKSVEGLVGGVIGATLLGGVFAVVLLHFQMEIPAGGVALFVGVSFVGALLSIVGDMAASAIKRHCGIKDFGKIFPGHGGFLDRLDSLLAVAPFVYLFVLWGAM